MKTHSPFVILLAASVGFSVTLAANTNSIKVWPARAEGFTQSLGGEWSFKYVPSLKAGDDADFYSPTFNVSAWKTIRVPSNWELQGFAEPGYDLKGLKDGLGLYRRMFRVPGVWRGDRRVILRFDGVAYGFETWVNGTKVGASSASAYNLHAFDITDALHRDAKADNVLAVQVTTKPFAYEFDVNDDWSLGGICRDVTLFSVPTTHAQDLTTRTKLTTDGAAELSVSVKVSQPGAEVGGRLFASDGETVCEFRLSPQTNGCFAAVVKVVQPQLWTAETPTLYRLQLLLSAKGQALQTIEERIGLREISIKDGVLLFNGHPFKIRGVNHHDLDWKDGRAITEEEMRRDLDLMKKGNINFIRTSHYAPNQRFLQFCDEMGFYVMDEVSIGKGEQHDNDPAYRDNILARVEATLARDKNHPSVIIWSIGNENPMTDLLLEAGRHAKKLDPTRPICFPMTPSVFRENYDKIPGFVDIYDEHYPGDVELRELAQKVRRPMVFSEYAHALGLAADRIQDQWERMQQTPQFAGGAIWHFQDQGILRASERPVDRGKSTPSVWLDKEHLYDVHGNDGCDGIVYPDRTPQADFWEVRKVYSPVQIFEIPAVVKPGTQEISFTVENRHDFRTLAGMKLAWSLQRNGVELQQGEFPLKAAAHEKETALIPVNIPRDAANDVLALNVRCFDEAELQITERVVRLDFFGTQHEGWLATLPATGKPDVTESETEIKIALPQWMLTVARTNGALSIKESDGRVLVAGIYPHPGRKFTMAEERASSKTHAWRASTLTQVKMPEVKVTQAGETVRLAVSGTYPGPGTNGQAFVGGYQLEITPSGAMNVSYDYAPTKAKGMLTEAGLSLVLPSEFTEFRWIGQGIYAGYPGKDQLNEFGLFHLNREDLRFQGNRRASELALLTTSTGAGVALVTKPADVAVQREGDHTLLSHNAVISGLGNKGEPPATEVKAEETDRIAGSFTVVPLGEKWPAPLIRWFGQPAAAKGILHPFYHSYDQ